MEDLIECPWCKNIPKLVVNDYKNKIEYAYYCDGNRKDGHGHYAESGWHSSEEEAREAWNKRC